MDGLIGRRKSMGILGAIAIGASLAATACAGPVLHELRDPLRDRAWVLSREGVELDSRKRFMLPDWHWAHESYACGPALALGPAGEVLVTSNVTPALWRVDPVTYHVSRHELSFEPDTGREFGFSALAYSPELEAYVAVSTFGAGRWRIDRNLRSARPLPAGSSTGHGLERDAGCNTRGRDTEKGGRP